MRKGRRIPIDRRLERLCIHKAGEHEFGAVGDGSSVPAAEVAEHQDLVTVGKQMTRDDRADVAGAAGDQQLTAAPSPGGRSRSSRATCNR